MPLPAYHVPIARGGMGRILEAWDRRHQRRVALKVRLRSSAAIEARFAREVLLTARLQHPSIVALYDTGVLRSGEPFFVMKLIEGRSLAEVAQDAHTQASRLALLPHLLAVTEALAYAHEQRIIHRDLKPANVLIGTFAETVVIDWGLAKDLRATEEPEGSAPLAGEGTPEHDAPDAITVPSAAGRARRRRRSSRPGARARPRRRPQGPVHKLGAWPWRRSSAISSLAAAAWSREFHGEVIGCQCRRVGQGGAPPALAFSRGSAKVGPPTVNSRADAAGTPTTGAIAPGGLFLIANSQVRGAPSAPVIVLRVPLPP